MTTDANHQAAPAALGENILQFAPPGPVTLTTAQRDDVVRVLYALKNRVSDLKMAMGDNAGWFDRAMAAEGDRDQYKSELASALKGWQEDKARLEAQLAECRTDLATSIDNREIEAERVTALKAERDEAKRDAAIALGLPRDFSSQAAQLRQSKVELVIERDRANTARDAALARAEAAEQRCGDLMERVTELEAQAGEYWRDPQAIVTATASSCTDNGSGFCTSCSTVHHISPVAITYVGDTPAAPLSGPERGIPETLHFDCVTSGNGEVRLHAIGKPEGGVICPSLEIAYALQDVLAKAHNRAAAVASTPALAPEDIDALEWLRAGFTSKLHKETTYDTAGLAVLDRLIAYEIAGGIPTQPAAAVPSDTRRPLPPDVLASAMHDKVHEDAGPSRAARGVRAAVPSESPEREPTDEEAEALARVLHDKYEWVYIQPASAEHGDRVWNTDREEQRVWRLVAREAWTLGARIPTQPAPTERDPGDTSNTKGGGK